MLKDFFHTRSFKILLASVFVLLGLMLYTTSVGSSVTANLLGFISAPMQKISTGVTTNAAVLAEDVTVSNEQLQAENNALKEEITKLREQLVDYYEMKQKNEQYETVLELKKANKDYQMLPATVIGRDPNDVFYSFSIDQGSLNGVSKNDPVITGDGVVGWVSEVYTTSSRVTTLFSPNTKIGAIAKKTRDTGVTGCDIQLADEGYIKLAYLTSENTIEAGDIITTTGLSGMYPKDLLIGTVKELRYEDNGVSQYALVEPFVDVKNVRDVFVLTDFEGKGEIAITESKSDDDKASASPSPSPSPSPSTSSEGE